MHLAPQLSRLHDSRRGSSSPHLERTVKKLKLDLEALSVASFATDAEPAGHGSVQARELGALSIGQTTTYCKTILTYCPCTPRWDGI